MNAAQIIALIMIGLMMAWNLFALGAEAMSANTDAGDIVGRIVQLVFTAALFITIFFT